MELLIQRWLRPSAVFPASHGIILGRIIAPNASNIPALEIIIPTLAHFSDVT